MRRGLALVLGVLAVTTARGEEGSDLERLQGKWTTAVGARKRNLVTVEIKGKAVAATIKTAQGLTLKAQGEVRIDESTTPKTLDWVKFATPDGRPVPELLGIYQIEGDKLTVRSGGFNDSRPTAFEPGEGVWAGVLTFERR